MEQGIYYKRGSKSDFAGVEILGDAMVLPRVIIEEIAFHETLTLTSLLNAAIAERSSPMLRCAIPISYKALS